jgi:phosphoglycerol transferase MdoB-like AlkP superfamily enzyme
MPSNNRPILSFLCMAAIPLWLVGYSTWSMRIAPDVIGFADHLAFVLLWVLVFLLLGVLPRRCARIAQILFIALIALIFVANLVYFRFFQTWMPLNSFWLWRDAIAIHASIRALIGWRDIVFGVCVPVALSLYCTRKQARVSPQKLIACCAALPLLFYVHVRFSSPELSYSQQNPIFELVRGQYRKWHAGADAATQLRLFQNRGNELLLVNDSLYKRSGSYQFPLEKIPIRETPLSAPKRLNVVLIMIESFRAFESGAYGADPSYTPNLDRIASEGLRFSTFYGNGSYTIKGEFSTLFSYLPDLHGNDAYVQYPMNNYWSLPGLLKNHGYTTHWMCATTHEFASAAPFLSKNGIDHMHDEIPARKTINLGASDEDLFAYAANVLGRAEEPFFAEVLTLTSHFPFDAYGAGISAHELTEDEANSYENYARGIHYADRALGGFFRAVQGRAWAERTIFVITGDHGVWIYPNDPSIDRIRKNEIFYRLPLIIWSPKLIKPGINTTIGSQIDIAPTILDLLQIYEKNYFLGTSLMRDDTGPRMVFTCHDERWNFRKQNKYLYDTGQEGFLDSFPYVKLLPETSKRQHSGFELGADLLRSGNPSLRVPLPLNEQSDLTSFAREALEAFSTLLSKNGIAPGNSGSGN